MMRLLSFILFTFVLSALLGCTPNSAQQKQNQASGRADLSIQRFGHGRVATEAEIAAWDIDVMPDGEGLPPGSGTVAAGRAHYSIACARCHGDKGRDGLFDPLAGRIDGDAFPFADDPRIPKTIGNYWPWATTLFDYIRRAMPQDRPGSLTNDQVYALTAYLLFLNDIVGPDARLDERSLPLIVMPARDRFVPDDRQGGPEIR